MSCIQIVRLQEKCILYRTSDVMTSRETHGLCVCIVLLVLVYWLGWMQVRVVHVDILFHPAFGNIASILLPIVYH